MNRSYVCDRPTPKYDSRMSVSVSMWNKIIVRMVQEQNTHRIKMTTQHQCK